ncbi:MAG: hypothetical protein HYX53_02380 [Chloroflexi bacterium]|nr:hypothetical protein [Chloroflexota bacterium]
MATKTLAEKLLIKPNAAVWASDAAQVARFGPLPEGAHAIGKPANNAINFVFANDAASLRETVAANREPLAAADSFWVAYPKGNRATINRDTIWPILAEYGMRPMGQVAIDDVWSAMRFRANKAGEEPFKGGGGG